MTRVFIVDDSPTTRRHLAMVYAASPELRVVGEAASLAEALPAVARTAPDLISLDVFLPSGTAASAVKALHNLCPRAHIILVSEAPRSCDEVFDALVAGALDFARKPPFRDEAAQQEFRERSQMFMETMNVDEMVAQLLVSEGFTSLEEVAFVDVEELTVIDGFDENTAEELQARARESLEEMNQKTLDEARALGTQEDLIEFEGLTPDIIIKLGENGVKSRDDLADLATDELIEILGKDQISEAGAETLIMKARAHWFADDDAAAVESVEEEIKPGLASNG